MSEYNKCCVPNPITGLMLVWDPVLPCVNLTFHDWEPKPDCVYDKCHVVLYRLNPNGSTTWINEVFVNCGIPVRWYMPPIEHRKTYFATAEARTGYQKCGEVRSPDLSIPA